MTASASAHTSTVRVVSDLQVGARALLRRASMHGVTRSAGAFCTIFSASVMMSSGEYVFNDSSPDRYRWGFSRTSLARVVMMAQGYLKRRHSHNSKARPHPHSQNHKPRQIRLQIVLVADIGNGFSVLGTDRDDAKVQSLRVRMLIARHQRSLLRFARVAESVPSA